MKFTQFAALVFAALTLNCAHTQPQVQTSNEPISTVRFRFDSDTLLEKYKSQLDNVIVELKSNPENKILISGYTDRIGEARYNLDLGDRRARAILGYLEVEGVSPERFIVVTYGETHSTALSYAESHLERKVVLTVLK